MKPKEVSVTFGKKVNLGDYNSAHVSITLSGEIEEGDDFNDVISQLTEQARNHVHRHTDAWEGKQKATVRNLYAGIPVEVGEGVATEDAPNQGLLLFDICQKLGVSGVTDEQLIKGVQVVTGVQIENLDQIFTLSEEQMGKVILDFEARLRNRLSNK